MKYLISMAWALAAAGATSGALACEACESAGPVADAMTVVRDAETGQLRAATAEELAAMRAKSATTAAKPVGAKASTTQGDRAAARAPVQVFATGARSSKLPAALASYSVVTRQADGSLDSRCIQGEAPAIEAIRSRQAIAIPAQAPRETE